MTGGSRKQVGRRTVLAGIGAGVLAMGAPVPLRRAWADQNLSGRRIRILTWTDVTGQAAVDHIAKPFSKETGAEVIADQTGATAEMVAKIKASAGSPQYDVVILSGVGAFELANAGLLAKPDRNKLPTLEQVFPDLQTGVGGYGIGYLLWTDGLIYDTRTFDTPPESFEVLWDDRFSGQLFLPPAKWIEAMELTIMAARLAGGDVQNPDPGFEKLKELRDRVVLLGENPQQVAEMFRTGIVKLGGVYAPQLLPSFIKNPDYHMSATLGMKEGFFYDLQYMVVPKGHPGDDDTTHAFMDYALRPEVQARMAKEVWYGPINRETKLDEEARRSPYIASPEDVAERGIRIDLDQLSTVRQDWIRRYTEIFGA